MEDIWEVFNSTVSPMPTDSQLVEESYMECNITCCIYDDGNEQNTLCFNEYNFTDINDVEVTLAWELAVRWIFVIVVVFFGFSGNLAIIIILFKNRLLMRTSVNYFILNMAIADFILSIAGPIPFTIRDTNQFWILGELWCHLDGFIQVTVMVVSVLSLSTISIDRLLGILKPMHMHLSQWQALLIIGSIWAFSAVCGVPFYIYRNFGERQWNDFKEIYCDEMTEKTFIYWLIIIIVLNWVPLNIMIVCYVLLFIGFKRIALKVEGKEHPGILRTKKKFVKMLFTMIVAFIGCWLPFQVFVMFREKLILKNDSNVEHDELYNIMFTTTQYIIYLNPAINPFIYGLMHDNFKKGFRVTFPCFFKHKPEYVLMAGYGSQAYVWNRQSPFRHTIAGTPFERRNRQPGQENEARQLRRAFSFNHSPAVRVRHVNEKRLSMVPPSPGSERSDQIRRNSNTLFPDPFSTSRRSSNLSYVSVLDEFKSSNNSVVRLELGSQSPLRRPSWN